VEGMGKPIIYLASNTYNIPQSMSHKNVLIYSEASLENEFIKGL
jgi:hypothetical protein